MESSPIERAVTALESIAKSLSSIEVAMYASHDDPENCCSIANVLNYKLDDIHTELLPDNNC